MAHPGRPPRFRERGRTHLGPGFGQQWRGPRTSRPGRHAGAGKGRDECHRGRSPSGGAGLRGGRAGGRGPHHAGRPHPAGPADPGRRFGRGRSYPSDRVPQRGAAGPGTRRRTHSRVRPEKGAGGQHPPDRPTGHAREPDARRFRLRVGMAAGRRVRGRLAAIRAPGTAPSRRRRRGRQGSRLRGSVFPRRGSRLRGTPGITRARYRPAGGCIRHRRGRPGRGSPRDDRTADPHREAARAGPAGLRRRRCADLLPVPPGRHQISRARGSCPFRAGVRGSGRGDSGRGGHGVGGPSSPRRTHLDPAVRTSRAGREPVGREPGRFPDAELGLLPCDGHTALGGSLVHGRGGYHRGAPGGGHR